MFVLASGLLVRGGVTAALVDDSGFICVHYLSFASGLVTALACAVGSYFLLHRTRPQQPVYLNGPTPASPMSPTLGLPAGGGAGAITPPEGGHGGAMVGTTVEFQWYVKNLKRPRGSLISPNFNFADLEWQLSIDGADGGVYLAANGRGVHARYRISVVEGDVTTMAEKTRAVCERHWVSAAFEEFGEKKWGCPGVMGLFYGKNIVVTVAFAQVISPVNHVTPTGQWLVGIDHFGGDAAPAPASHTPPERASPPPPGATITYRGTPLRAVQRKKVFEGEEGRDPPVAAAAGSPSASAPRKVMAVPLGRGVEPRILVEEASPRPSPTTAPHPKKPGALGSSLPPS
eukprot:Hpha_TRINITY_DN5312_c0_g1::TRINITY_DN5312_c0_g1_i1::g.32780::m.32780